MPGIPYLPGGVAELPAERFILFADNLNDVMRIDESVFTKDGASFTARYDLPTLNQLREGHQFTLRAFELYYVALTTTSVRVLSSGDGGQTYSAAQVVALPQTTGRIARVWVTFEGLTEATGDDLRVRLEFDQNALPVIYGYRPHLVDRGELII